MRDNRTLLTNLLQTLVREWGAEEVERALKEVSTPHRRAGYYYSSRPDSAVKPRRKPLAVEQVQRVHLPNAQKSALGELAVRFDHREFLPTNSNVREFLAVVGATPKPVKDRSDAFRQILRVLSGFSVERLQKLARSQAHSGPAQLGPLSEAISAAAQSLPRQREPNAS